MTKAEINNYLSEAKECTDEANGDLILSSKLTNYLQGLKNINYVGHYFLGPNELAIAYHFSNDKNKYSISLYVDTARNGCDKYSVHEILGEES